MFVLNGKRLVMLALGLLFLMSGMANAQQVNAIAVGVVDVQAIMQKSKAGQNIQSQLDDKRKEYQSQISSKETGLRDKEKGILDQKDSLSEAEFTKQRKAFEQDVLEAQKMVQDNKRSLEDGFGNALAQLHDEVRETIAAVAKERKYAMVLSNDAVIIAEKSMDITDEVIEDLDKRITKIKIDWSVKN